MKAWKKEFKKYHFKKNELKQEFNKLLWEQKRIKEVVKYIQICISKREHYEGYRRNLNDKNYMMMNWKDIEAYQKSYEEIDIFLKQFPHLKGTVLEGLKKKSGKNLFRKLNEHSKELQAKQEKIIKKHNSLATQYDELEHLKVNMNEYLGRNKVEKKESVIGAVKKYKRKIDKTVEQSHSRKNEIEL